MKEYVEAILLMLEAEVITKKEAKEIYLRAIEDWLKPHDHSHEEYENN